MTRTACFHNCRVLDKSNMGLGFEIKDNMKLEDECENNFDPRTRNVRTSMLWWSFFFLSIEDTEFGAFCILAKQDLACIIVL